jgi:hypothetical protein
MTPATNELLELAERCEAATGPDRELDGLIEVARDPMREVILYNEPGPFPQKAVRGPIKDLLLTGEDLAYYIFAPRYTASLDAAMTLVPSGWAKSLEEITCDDASLIAQATVWQGDRPKEAGAENSVSLALALCAAALRTQATEKGE